MPSTAVEADDEMEPRELDAATKVGGWFVAFLTFLLGAHSARRVRKEHEQEQKMQLRRQSDERISNIEHRLTRVEEGLPYIQRSIDETKELVKDMRDTVMRPCSVCRLDRDHEAPKS